MRPRLWSVGNELLLSNPLEIWNQVCGNSLLDSVNNQIIDSIQSILPHYSRHTSIQSQTFLPTTKILLFISMHIKSWDWSVQMQFSLDYGEAHLLFLQLSWFSVAFTCPIPLLTSILATLLQQAPSLRSRWIAKTNLRWVSSRKLIFIYVCRFILYALLEDTYRFLPRVVSPRT